MVATQSSLQDNGLGVVESFHGLSVRDEILPIGVPS